MSLQTEQSMKVFITYIRIIRGKRQSFKTDEFGEEMNFNLTYSERATTSFKPEDESNNNLEPLCGSDESSSLDRYEKCTIMV